MTNQIDAMLAEDMGRFFDDPYGFVLYAFEWGKGELENSKGPREWQRDELKRIGLEVKGRRFNGKDPVAPILEAISSGHGIGKSALVSWLILWIMSTRPFAKGVVTANTGAQLESKTWSELGKWHRRCITGRWFDISSGKGSMKLVHKDYPESWRCDAQTCREENSESFAGLHAADSTPFYIFDEASAVPDKIWEVAEGGLTDGEPMWFAFGNPTRNTGRFHACFNKLKHRWNTRRIDSRTVEGTNKEQIEQWIQDYGEDSDFVKVRVRGIFPSASSNQFIESSLVTQAMKTEAISNIQDPLLMGVDVARFGSDETVFTFRLGLDGRTFDVIRKQKMDTMQVAAHVASIAQGTTHTAGRPVDAIFIDSVGVGAGVYDRLLQMGFNNLFAVNGANSPIDPKYANKRAEMYGRLKDWLIAGGALPDDNEIFEQFSAQEYSFDRRNKLILEGKEDMKRRGLSSPDIADSYSLTFAEIVPPRDFAQRGGQTTYETEYDIN